MYIFLIVMLLGVSQTTGQPGKCDQTPPQATVLEPSENKDTYHLNIDTKDNNANIYRPDQTYVLILTTNNQTRPFRWFMITVEDPDVDKYSEFDHRSVDVGSLKTLDTNRQSRYSERCYNSVENTDNSDKYRVEIHWVSPKQNDVNQRVRLRAMVAENEEVWYVGENLTTILDKDDRKPLDSPPYSPVETCNLCSEARYEVIFKGKWSRMSHPRNYPSKPDDNYYSHLVGASHSFHYIMWQPGDKASPGLKKLAEEADISVIEREIIDAMSPLNGTRTLIRGKRRLHPNMFEPSHSLFRVDRIHHMFSVLIAMKPSPDWFLGANKFELCTDVGWLEHSEIPLYPWDAGTMDGISYESPTSVTQPVDSVDRVAVGSFNKESPFYQMNLNDLKPFAYLQVRRLAVYPLVGVDCEEERPKQIGLNNTSIMSWNYWNIPLSSDGGGGDKEKGVTSENDAEALVEPLALTLKKSPVHQYCNVGEWGDWSPCVSDDGFCGIGTQVRRWNTSSTRRYKDGQNEYPPRVNCQNVQNGRPVESQTCFIDCENENVD